MNSFIYQFVLQTPPFTLQVAPEGGRALVTQTATGVGTEEEVVEEDVVEGDLVVEDVVDGDESLASV